jgi:hypothetical protein
VFQTSQAQQSGQSWTLEVHKDGLETVVTCAAVPEVGSVRDVDGRYAVQHMRRLLDDHTHRGYQQDRSSMIVGRGELLDD